MVGFHQNSMRLRLWLIVLCCFAVSYRWFPTGDSGIFHFLTNVYVKYYTSTNTCIEIWGGFDHTIPFKLLMLWTISNMAIYWPRIFHDEILSIILPRKYLYCSTKICIWRINIGILMSVSQCQHITVKYLSYLSKISTFLKSSLSKKN